MGNIVYTVSRPTQKLTGEKQKFFGKNWKMLFVVGLLVLSLPLTMPLAQNAWKYLIGASFEPASLVVQTDQNLGNVNRVWEGISQGHEEKDLRLNTTVGLVKPLGIKYIRIDHILNGFDVVSRTNEGKLAYDFTKLDLLVGDITAMGATPYFAVSYMPPAISRGDIIDNPREWGEYGQVVGAYIAHYSRDYRGGLSNVVYEIWNEPDLFGGFKTYGDKNYLTLYRTAAQAAARVTGTKPYLIGGPATTGFYANWATDYYTKLADVRKDFFSWHRYSAEVDDFVKDAKKATDIIAPLAKDTQRLFISEWGVNSERGSAYDGKWAAAHYLAVTRALVDTNVDLALAFEIQDGKGGSQYHGGWGMLTNSEYGPVAKKPRFHAMELIQRIQGARLPIAGEGSYVTALAARDNNGIIRVLAVNYDPKGSHEELFPLSLAGLDPGTYSVTEEYFSGRKLTVNIDIPGQILKRDIMLTPSESVLVTVTR